YDDRRSRTYTERGRPLGCAWRTRRTEPTRQTPGTPGKSSHLTRTLMNKLLLALQSFLTLGVVNTSTSPGFQSDVELFIQEEVEPLARRPLVAYQFGKPLHL